MVFYLLGPDWFFDISHFALCVDLYLTFAVNQKSHVT